MLGRRTLVPRGVPSGVEWAVERARVDWGALRPGEFHNHALAAADGEHRLPLARMTGWDISSFEPGGRGR
jgi:hypothetical protein